jgi:hypothetical protein
MVATAISDIKTRIMRIATITIVDVVVANDNNATIARA